MTRPVVFHFVDVFADSPLQGNPVSLVPDADGLDEPTMRAIAREFNQSETTFVLAPTAPGATVRLRSFTPSGAEVFGAGHNALGAWLWLADAGRIDIVGSTTGFRQQIGDEVLPVQVTRPAGAAVEVSMTHSAPLFGATVTDHPGLAAALGLAGEDLVAGAVAQVVSTGAGHLLVPLISRAAVDRATPDATRLGALLQAAGGEGCYLFSREVTGGSDAVAYTRFFNPLMGISEDPATGTAAGPLVAFLVRSGVIPDGVTAVVEQGHLVGRPSRIRVTVAGNDVRVSGSGLVVATGTLFL